MNRILIILSIIFSLSAFAQEINQVDSQGRKQGMWKKPFDNVKVYRYTGQFKDDIPYGKFVYFYETGSVQAIVIFSEKGKVSRSQMYHNSGYMMAQGKYIDQKKDSIWVYYDDRGFVSYQESYLKGELNGQKVYFYAPRDEKLYVSRYEYYKNGVLHGEFKEFHENTSVKIQGNYLDGNLNGLVTEFHPNGKIKKVMHYKFAVKHGNWAFYNEKGVLIGTKMFWEGKLLEGDEAEKKKAIWEAERKK